MRRTHAWFKIAGLAVVTGGLAWGLPQCAGREPRVEFPPLNKPLTLMPAVVNQTGPVRMPPGELAAVSGLHLTFMWGGGPLSDPDLELRFYKAHGSETPALTIRWGDLKTLYQVSGCSNEQIASLDGPGTGVALVCDGRLKLDEFVLIEGVNAKGEKRTATSWATWRLADDVAAASILLL